MPLPSSTSPNDLLNLSASLDGSASGISMSGPLTLNGAIAVSGAATIAGAATVTGAATFAGALVRTSLGTGITAFAGGGQGSAVALTAGVNDVTTVGSAADSVKLPSPTAGMQVIVANTAAANSMNLFPNTGHSINNGAGNAAVAVAAGKTAICTAISTTKWLATVGA